ncbi:MAG: hypothetical protein KDD89_11740, partial [Anaerolineales bacterium]|nr:hypothetical protein [Anaerolineales bacterium]
IVLFLNRTITHIDHELGVIFEYPATWELEISANENGGKTFEFLDDGIQMAIAGVAIIRSDDLSNKTAKDILMDEFAIAQENAKNAVYFAILQAPETVPHDHFDVAMGNYTWTTSGLPFSFQTTFKVFDDGETVTKFAIAGRGSAELIPSIESGYNLILESFDLLQE